MSCETPHCVIHAAKHTADTHKGGVMMQDDEIPDLIAIVQRGDCQLPSQHFTGAGPDLRAMHVFLSASRVGQSANITLYGKSSLSGTASGTK